MARLRATLLPALRQLPRQLDPGGRGPALLLGAMVVIGLWLRLENNDYGLPYVYNYDEANHFTDKAVKMLSGSLNPDYFQNPSGFTYLVYAMLRLKYGLLGFLFDLPEDSLTRQFRIDASPIWEDARTLAAFVCMVGSLTAFYVAKRLWGVREGLVTAAILIFAFLPVVYSRIALTDVGTFLPVALVLLAAIRVWETGRWEWYATGGVGVGLAIGFKYTSGLVVAPFALAAALRFLRDRGTPLLKRPDLRFSALSAGLAVAAFGVTSPFVYLKPREAGYQLKTQANEAGDVAKIGQAQDSAFGYYLDSLTWGLGWALVAAALLGIVLMARRDRMRALLLVLFPIVLFLYMSQQSRYFGRWLLPSYPALAMIAAYGLVRASELVRARPRLQGLALGALTALALAQPLAADVRSLRVLGKEDTRQLARDFLQQRYPAGLRIVVEPGVPDDYYRLRPGVQCTKAERDEGLPECQAKRKKQFVRGFVKDLRSSIAIENPDGSQNYVRTLRAENLDLYRRAGFCLVMTLSVIRGRAENDEIGPALDYYERLERESDLIFSQSPYDAGADPVPFHFDLSYNYYPPEFERPGPHVNIYELSRCRQRYGKMPERPQGVRGLEKGMGSAISTPL